MTVNTIGPRLAEIKRHIRQTAVRSGRSPDDIRLVAVSKTRSLDEVKQAIEAGQRDFGENTVQDALSKIPFVTASSPEWHFIGHLQSKKARYIPDNFQWIHSVDSLKLAQKLSNAMIRSTTDDSLNCLIQVNVAGEASKSGLKPDQVVPFLDELQQLELPGLQWRGLMTIGVQGDEGQTRAAFRGLKRLLVRCQQQYELARFDQLSMGMTDDYAIAIEEGSTMVRVGTAIFGHRDTRV